MYPVLFVCDQKEEWELFTRLFRVHFKQIEVTCVLSVADVKSRLELNPDFSFILIDTALREREFNEFFEYCSNKIGHRPILFVGTEVFLKDRVPDNLYDHNMASGLILRPIIIGDFISTVKRALAWIKEKEVKEATIDMAKENFMPVKIRNLYRFDKIPYDAYMEISDNKFMRVLERNVEYNEKLISKFIKRGVKRLYFEKKDQIKFLTTATINLIQFFDSSQKVPIHKILRAQIRACGIIHEYIRSLGLSDEIHQLTRKLLESIYSTYNDLRDFRSFLVQFPIEVRDIPEKSILTAYLCEALSLKMGWNSTLVKMQLGVASLFHDSMLFNDDIAVISHLEDGRLSEFSEDDQQDYLTHTTKAAEAIQFLQGFPEADFIVLQHHELPSGEGFPQGLNSHQLTSLVCVFIISNNFACELFKNGIHDQALLKSYDMFMALYNQGNFRQPLKHLKTMLFAK